MGISVTKLARLLQVNLHTNGLLARRCYYTLVYVLDAIYDRPAVAEHTGEVQS